MWVWKDDGGLMDGGHQDLNNSSGLVKRRLAAPCCSLSHGLFTFYEYMDMITISLVNLLYVAEG